MRNPFRLHRGGFCSSGVVGGIVRGIKIGTIARIGDREMYQKQLDNTNELMNMLCDSVKNSEDALVLTEQIRVLANISRELNRIANAMERENRPRGVKMKGKY